MAVLSGDKSSAPGELDTVQTVDVRMEDVFSPVDSSRERFDFSQYELLSLLGVHGEEIHL